MIPFMGIAPPYIESRSVMMAMSGGVDSSVSALLLLEDGFDVTGATMELLSGCASSGSKEMQDAKAICAKLGIPHVAFDMSGLFEREVIDRFCRAYLEGQTPNPCVDCNKALKFGALDNARRDLGIEYLATGHYARSRFDEETARWQLLRARDLSKDQSYFLYNITQEQLSRTMFPLGSLTKDEVRGIAREHGFSNAEKTESQDICFVQDEGHISFIESRIPHAGATGAFQPGDIVDRAGNVLGTHMGLACYTIGQRKGIGVAAPEPLYVFAKDVERNELIVGTADEVMVDGVIAGSVNLISASEIEAPRRVQAKTHYRQKPVDAIVSQTGEDELSIAFAEPQRAAAPGQAAVLYNGEEVLGGGTIKSCF